MSTIADRVRQISTTTGSGTLALSASVTGFRTFAQAFGNGTVVYYAAVNIMVPAEWEVGIGIYSANTLARTTILASSAGAPTAVSFSVGTKDVFVTAPAAQLVLQDASGNVTLPGNLTVTGAITGSTRLVLAVRTEASDYTVSPTDALVLANAVSGTQTITLPSAATVTGRTYTIKRLTPSGAAVVQIAGSGGQLIDGVVLVALSNRYDAITVVSTGTAWSILSQVSANIILEG